MNWTRLLAGAVVTSLGVAASGADPQSREALERNPDLKWSPSHILVKFRPGVDPAMRDAALAWVNAGMEKEFALVPGLELVRVAGDPEDAANVLAVLQNIVEFAEPDHVVRHTVNPNDTYYNLLWGLHNTGQTVNGDPGIADADIDAAEAWDITTGDPNFVIAVIDTGTNYSHADLAANIWSNPGEVAGNGVDDDGNGYIDDIRGWDFYSNDSDPADSDGHGTHTAGTIGAVGNNGIGVAGVNWRCRLMPLRFLGPNGGYISDAIEALDYCVDHGVKVSNNSWGGGGYSSSMYTALNNARAAGHLFVAAAGNAGTNNDSSPFYPASYNLDNVLSVAATNNNDGRASFSNYGATSVDLGAPGVMIASTYGTSGYAYLDGTSMAAPHVAGVAGLVYAQNPGWTYSQVRQRLLTTTRPVSSLSGITVTGGVVNALAALSGGGGGNTAPTVTISSPAAGATFNAGASITFSGSASDTQDGSLTASLVWTSSLQGQIGTGGSFARSDLVLGTHTITASVTDSAGLSGSSARTVTVQSAPATPPAAPSNLTAVRVSVGVASIGWSDNSSNETSFQLQRQTRVGGFYTNTVTFTRPADSTAYTDSPGSGRYRYRIRATNSAGSSAYTAWRTVDLR